MEIKDYITKNLPNLNWNILPQIFEENNVELTEEIEAYLRNTPGNTNWNVFEGMSSDGGEESWPKLIHVIYDSDYVMADDSDFSTFSEAYDFITNTWAEYSEKCTSEYIVLKVMDSEIQADNGRAYIASSHVSWYKGSTIYSLSQDNFRILSDD